MRKVAEANTNRGEDTVCPLPAARGVPCGVERSPTALLQPGLPLGPLPHRPGDFPLRPALRGCAPGSNSNRRGEMRSTEPWHFCCA